MTSMADLQELSVNHLEYFICFKFEGSRDGAEGSFKKKECSEGKLYMGDVCCRRTFDLSGLSSAAVKVVKRTAAFSNSVEALFQGERAEMNKMFDKAWKIKGRSIMLLRCVLA